MKRIRSNPNKQRGISLIDFIMYLILAVFLFLGIVKLYNMATAWSAQANTVSAVTQIKAGAEKVKSVNHTGTSMSKVCSTGRNSVSSTICGDTRDGVGTNEYGGDYTLTVDSANMQRVKVGITNIDTQYIDDLADTLAKLSAGNCNSAASCATLAVSGNVITVTL
ncbi:PilS-like protein [Vibrio crassostreae]|uniref:PilS-like protein n=2 Tax=Vibrio TaxID=662 RepID=A0A4R3P393_9VIBR|nr:MULTISPECIES: hypothetical protein [Vibrio]MDH5919874.1 hypothetical protein [Vibrio splendidus]MDH5951253.1 hypothetical protein [Vibrio crassostreae]TCN05537.1 hypothetical protein EDB35_11633 [Vibrio crassostreae]TCT46195.1 hypothetical protein EDB39_11467 [Vibrio crassostreae]TCT54198.1 hypothetical protein EDB40_11485 [Vibrio crassostreae]